MNKQEDINKKLFNRLFLKMSSIRRLKKPISNVNNIKLEKSVKYLYYSDEMNMWFGYGETINKYIYFFGTIEESNNTLDNVKNSLIVDFDKNRFINNNTLGIIGIIKDEPTFYLNKKILEEKYTNNNFTYLTEHTIHYSVKHIKIEIPTFEIGNLYGDFIINLEKLVKEISLKSNQKSEHTNSQSMNLFLNAIKAGKTYHESLRIANIDSADVKYWYKNGREGNKEFIKFYNTYKEIMPKDESIAIKMKNIIDSLKSGESEEESIRKASANSRDVKKWYENGKKGEPEFIEFYENYKPIAKKNKSDIRTKNKQINNDLINAYINLINEGKTNKESIEKLNIPDFKIKNWKMQGQLGNKDYQEFYNSYQKGVEREKLQKLEESKKEDQKLIKSYINLINEGKTNKEAFETLNIPRFKTKNWKTQGQLGNKDYQEFYETYQKAVKIDEIKKSKQFITLINEGKTNEEAIKLIKMPDFKIKQWFNSGKNGDEDFVDFYNAYMKQYETSENEVEKVIPKSNPKPAANKETNKNKKICEICGRTINEKSTNTICKRCLRKQHCANILQTLLQSIEPKVPFKKEDLKRLNFTSIQIQDSIWTLQEFNLIIKEKNNKYSLVNKEILDNFIKESGVEIIETGQNTVKLTKKCEVCGETLEISKFPVNENNPDGYEDTCKSCRKLITSARYLKELLNYITYDEEFSEDDLVKFVPDPFLRQAKIWSLLDNDLIIKNSDNNKFKLTNKKECEEFLNNYYQETSKQKPTTEPLKTPKTPLISEKQKQMEIVLNARKEGKSRKEAAKLAGISLYKITHWYKEGRDRFGEDNIYFYNEMKKIEEKLKKELTRKINTILKALKKGDSLSQAIDEASTTQEELNSWIKKGENGIRPYDSFLRQYTKYIKKSTDYHDENNIKARKKFLKYIREGKTRKDASKQASIDLKLLDSWIIKGTKGQNPYKEFYNEYKKAREEAREKPNSKQDGIKKEFIKLLENGYTLGEASKQIENGQFAIDIKKWYVAGKKGVKSHIKFYMDCQKAKNKFKDNKSKLYTLIADGFTIKESCEKLNLNPVKIKIDILKGRNGEEPYKEFYSKIIESKTSLIDMKQLFDKKSHPHKNQMIDLLDLLLIGTSESEALKIVNVDESTFKYWINRGKQQFGELYAKFYEIYAQIKSGELINKFKKEIDKEIIKELDEIEDENADILAPLPKEIKRNLDAISKETHTGFAWVNKINGVWTYSKRTDGQNIEIKDNDIYNLHKKVIKNNLMWGVRNLEKAKENLGITDSEKKFENSNDILAPLSKDIITKFSKGTSTGFAWVSKSGNYYYYTRANMNVRIKSSSIFDLHKQVVNNNLDWGVISLTKARKILNGNTAQNIETEYQKPKPINTDILAPLPEDIENELSKYSKGTSTGFAWVSKLGTKFSYTKVHNNNEIIIRDSSIQELHKKVINKNLPWGVRDLEKAKKTLNEKTEEQKPKKSIETHSISKDIYAPFPKEYEHFFKSTPINKSGIAWVNKIGNRWTYSRKIDGKLLEISDNNIFKLHKKVIELNQLWGIRDYEKAKLSLISKPIDDNDHILKPVSNQLVNTYPSNCGFAMVNKIGDNFEYTRTYNGKKLSDNTIFGLYEQILDKNLLWGVIDLNQAMKAIGIKKLPEWLKTPTDNNKTKTIKKNKTKNKTKQITLEEIPISKNILAPLPDILKQEFKTGSNDPTGFAWVRKYSGNWYYIRTINNEQITIKDKDLRTLHNKVINKNLHWGVRNVEKAKESLYGRNVKTNKNFLDNNDKTSKKIFNILQNKKQTEILTLLPSNIKNEFNDEFYDNQSGFAWVKKIDDDWIYERNLYGTTIKIKYKDFFKLYDSIKNNNHDWGIIDSNKAKLTLAEVLEISDIKLKNPETISSEPLEYSQKAIFAPISQRLRHFVKTDTGFAFVNKDKDKWNYRINNTNEIISNDTIIGLFEKVSQKGLLWGVTDIDKAKKSMNEDKIKEKETSKNEKIPKTVQKSSNIKSKDDNQKRISKDILAPLPKEYESTIKPNPADKTGIAWVTKIGNQWTYSRTIDGESVFIKDNDIYRLHKKVIRENLLWGIRDYDKAKKVLFNTQSIEEIKPKEQKKKKESKSVFVNITGNIASIEGKIKNDEVLGVLTKIYEYGDAVLKMNTRKSDNETSLSIELILTEKQKIEFKNKIKEFGWEITK